MGRGHKPENHLEANRMKPLDLPAVVAFLKANSENPADPGDPYMQAIAHIDRLANALIDANDGDSWYRVQFRTGLSPEKCKNVVEVSGDALAYLLGK
jgi:hypothetical protein